MIEIVKLKEYIEKTLFTRPKRYFSPQFSRPIRVKRPMTALRKKRPERREIIIRK